ncbi:unnamed protein product [Euphydryas editha]|uniref:Uncharacterized protein n=1 Tax=Euphydryas editha TaxID=104508 RepID=A0AAU9TH48_EUPED|nr:unnamed protein product [Euphydryas editha]
MVKGVSFQNKRTANNARKRMFAIVVLTALAISFAVSQYEYSITRDLPNYIKSALRQKNRFKPMLREKKRTITNLTLQEVFDKIKDITRALNQDAKKNGYFVDYKFRILEDNGNK